MNVQTATADQIVERILQVAASDGFKIGIDLGRSLAANELPALWVRQPDGTESRERLTMAGTYLATYIYRLYAFYRLITSPKLEREAVLQASGEKERLPRLFAARKTLHLNGGDGLVYHAQLLGGDQVEVTDFHNKSYAMIPYDLTIQTIETL